MYNHGHSLGLWLVHGGFCPAARILQQPHPEITVCHHFSMCVSIRYKPITSSCCPEAHAFQLLLKDIDKVKGLLAALRFGCRSGHMRIPRDNFTVKMKTFRGRWLNNLLFSANLACLLLSHEENVLATFVAAVESAHNSPLAPDTFT